MWKWIVEIISRFQGSGIKIGRVNFIRVAKPLIFYNILCACCSLSDVIWAIVFFALNFHLLLLSLYTLGEGRFWVYENFDVYKHAHHAADDGYLRDEILFDQL